MAYTDIDKSDDYFNTVLYTGNASSRSITGVNFQPDWVWIKRRSTGDAHYLFDNVRTATKYISSNNTDTEVTNANTLTSFDSDGFSLGTVNETNKSGETFVSWNWLASNTTASNTDGSITSTVSANTTSGFSVVTWTGDGNKSATVGHGLGSELSCIIIKERTGGDWWHNWQTGLSGDSYNIFLNNTEPQRSAYNDGHVKKLNNSTTFGFDSSTSNVDAVNQSGVDNVGYCFAEKKGFSRFGSYVGNGSSDGSYIHLGFKPAFIMTKRTDSSTGGSWQMYDNKRLGYNVDNNQMKADKTNAEDTSDGLDILSNGFKMRNSGNSYNASGASYIYMAFAENPFVTSTGIPGTAR